MKETHFKQTDLGLIPEDWDVVELGERSEIYRGGSPRPIEAYLTNLPNGINWIKIGDVSPNAKYIEHTEERIKQSGVAHSRRVYKGDFLLSNSMSFGRPYILKVDGCIHDGWLVVQNYNATFNSDYLYYILGAEQTLKQYNAMVAGSSVQNLNKEKVSKVCIPIPSLPEQKRIADMLSRADELLVRLDKLIAKKQAVKQGAMQQLLTGRTRLKGFNEPWKEVNIASDTTVKARIGWQGLTTDEYLDNGRHLLVGGTDFLNGSIDWEHCKYVSEWRYKQDVNIQLKNGDVLISKDGTIGKVAYVRTLPKTATLNSGVFVIRSIKEELQQEFLALVFLSPIFKEFMDKLVAGSTIQHLYQKDIVNFSFYIPPTETEQCSIARIITHMDKEIESLHTERRKVEQVKKGMMQQLLTGKIRLSV